MLERQTRVEAENNTLVIDLSNLDKKIATLEQDKKKFAGQKKFKEAQKAQQEIKDNQQVKE